MNKWISTNERQLQLPHALQLMERVLLDGIQLIVVQMSAPTQITKSVKLFQLLESNMKLHQLQLRGTAEIGGCKTLDVVVHQIAAKAKSSHIITMIEID